MAQIKAALAANAELILHYWEILASHKRETFRRSHGADAVDLKSVQTGADDYLH